VRLCTIKYVANCWEEEEEESASHPWIWAIIHR